MTTKETKKVANKAKAKKVSIRSEKTIEQLAKEQGVKPFDPSEDGKNWPKGASYKKFIDAIHSGRK